MHTQSTTGMSFKAIGRQMGYHYAVVSRLVRKHLFLSIHSTESFCKCVDRFLSISDSKIKST
jgi:protein-L-isoaspartate O-methyltransferase